MPKDFKTRPSPPFPATEFPEGKIAKGNDGNDYVVSAPNKNGIKKWIRSKLSGGDPAPLNQESYLTPTPKVRLSPGEPDVLWGFEFEKVSRSKPIKIPVGSDVFFGCCDHTQDRRYSGNVDVLTPDKLGCRSPEYIENVKAIIFNKFEVAGLVLKNLQKARHYDPLTSPVRKLQASNTVFPLGSWPYKFKEYWENKTGKPLPETFGPSLRDAFTPDSTEKNIETLENMSSHELCLTYDFMMPSSGWINAQVKYFGKRESNIPSGKNLVTWYTTEGNNSGYRMLNGFLRGTLDNNTIASWTSPWHTYRKKDNKLETNKKLLKKYVEELDKYIEESPPSDRDIYVYRGISGSFAKATFEAWLNDSERELIDKGYSSFSWAGTVSAGFIQDTYRPFHGQDIQCCLIQTIIPSGTRCLDLTKYSRFSFEREILLPSNSFKLQPTGMRIVDLKLPPPQPFTEKFKDFRTKKASAINCTFAPL